MLNLAVITMYRARDMELSRFFLDFVDDEGNRVLNITGVGFSDLGEAKLEAAKIVAEYVGGGGSSPVLGHLEVVDQTGSWIMDIHFP